MADTTSCTCGGRTRHKPGCERYVGKTPGGGACVRHHGKRAAKTKHKGGQRPKAAQMARSTDDIHRAAVQAARAALKRKLEEELVYARAYLAELEGMVKA